MAALGEMGADLLAEVGRHLPRRDRMRLQGVARRWQRALRLPPVWREEAVASFAEFCRRAQALDDRRRCHLFFYLHKSLPELEAGVPGRVKRLTREILSLHADPCGAWQVEPEPNMFEKRWYANILGPRDTPYEGLKLSAEIRFPEEYPFRPPRVHLGPLWHVNVTEHGAISPEILHHKWSPALMIRNVLLYIESMLHKQDTECPFNMEACEQYLSSKDEFYAAVQAHAEKHGKEYWYPIATEEQL